MKLFKIKNDSTNQRTLLEPISISEGSNIDGVSYRDFGYNDRFVKNDTALLESLLQQILAAK